MHTTTIYFVRHFVDGKSSQILFGILNFFTRCTPQQIILSGILWTVKVPKFCSAFLLLLRYMPDKIIKEIAADNFLYCNAGQNPPGDSGKKICKKYLSIKIKVVILCKQNKTK